VNMPEDNKPEKSLHRAKPLYGGFSASALGWEARVSRAPELSESSNSEEDPARCGGFWNAVNDKMKSGLQK